MYFVGNLCYEKYWIIILVECIIDFCGRIWVQILEHYVYSFILVFEYSLLLFLCVHGQDEHKSQLMLFFLYIYNFVLLTLHFTTHI